MYPISLIILDAYCICLSLSVNKWWTKKHTANRKTKKKKKIYRKQWRLIAKAIRCTQPKLPGDYTNHNFIFEPNSMSYSIKI